MGSFSGHTGFGSCFMVFSLWWTWSFFHKFLVYRRTMATRAVARDQKKKSIKWRNTLSFPVYCCPRVPVEAIFKILITICGAIDECTVHDCSLPTHMYNNLQHLTIYLMFGLHGVIELLSHYHKGMMFLQLDYITLLMALFTEGFILDHHLHNKTTMNVSIHVILKYVILAQCISVLWEMIYKSSILACLARIYFTFLQATWLCQAGFILYSPFGSSWKENDEKQSMLVVISFIWHVIGVFLVMFITVVCINIKIKYLSKSSYEKSINSYTSLKSLSKNDKTEDEEMATIINESEGEM